MNKVKTIFVLNIAIMFLVLIFQPIVISKSNLVIQRESLQPVGDSSVFVGEMEIKGDGNYNTAYVVANAVQKEIVKVDKEGSCVIFIADYYMECNGYLDGGHVELRVTGADTKVEETLGKSEGSLYTYLDNCTPGEILHWELIAAYDDFFFEEPIIVGDIGFGVCSPRSRSLETSTPFIFQILNRLIVRFNNFFPIFSNFLTSLHNYNQVTKGIIICE